MVGVGVGFFKNNHEKNLSACEQRQRGEAGLTVCSSEEEEGSIQR